MRVRTRVAEIFHTRNATHGRGDALHSLLALAWNYRCNCKRRLLERCGPGPRAEALMWNTHAARREAVAAPHRDPVRMETRRPRPRRARPGRAAAELGKPRRTVASTPAAAGAALQFILIRCSVNAMAMQRLLPSRGHRGVPGGGGENDGSSGEATGTGTKRACC